MLNKAPNNNNTTGVAINVRLTNVGAKQFSMMAVYSHHAEKLTY